MDVVLRTNGPSSGTNAERPLMAAIRPVRHFSRERLE